VILTQIYTKNKDALGTLGDEIIKYIKEKYKTKLKKLEFIREIDNIIKKFEEYKLDDPEKLNLLKSSPDFDKNFFYNKYTQP